MVLIISASESSVWASSLTPPQTPPQTLPYTPPTTPPRTPQNAAMYEERSMTSPAPRLLPSQMRTTRLDGALNRPSRSPDAMVYNGPTAIRDYLLVGGIENASDRIILTTLEITHILSISATKKNLDVPQNIKIKYISLVDKVNERAEPYFMEAWRWIGDARKMPAARVLVHCQEGISRSVTLVLAYLMREEHVSLKAAFYDVRSKRPSVEPNQTFLNELRQLEKELFGQIISTEALTHFDRGAADLSSTRAMAQDKIGKCLAMAPSNEPDAHQEQLEIEAAESFASGDVACFTEASTKTIAENLESFGSRSDRDERARQSLHRIFAHVAKRSDDRRVDIYRALSILSSPEVLADLTQDLPRAHIFLRDFLAAVTESTLP